MECCQRSTKREIDIWWISCGRRLRHLVHCGRVTAAGWCWPGELRAMPGCRLSPCPGRRPVRWQGKRRAAPCSCWLPRSGWQAAGRRRARGSTIAGRACFLVPCEPRGLLPPVMRLDIQTLSGEKRRYHVGFHNLSRFFTKDNLASYSLQGSYALRQPCCCYPNHIRIL